MLTVALLFCLYMAAEGMKKQLTIPKMFDRYTSCNGNRVYPPDEWKPHAMKAALSCVGYVDNDCFLLCVVHKYGDLIVNDNPNIQSIKTRAARVRDTLEGDEKGIKALDAMLKQLEFCTADTKYPFPQPADKCPKVAAYIECMDEKYEEVCKGKKPKG